MKLKSLFSITIFPVAIAALSVIGFSNQARAGTFSGNMNGSWGEPTPGDVNNNPFYSGVGKNIFTWGDPRLFDNASANQIVFEGNSFSTDANSLFKIGDLTYRNGTVLLGTSVESVPLNLSLSFNDSTEDKQVLEYELSLNNTINRFFDPDADADYVSFIDGSAKNNFTFGGDNYTLSLVGFSQDNGKTNDAEFRVREGEKVTSALYGKISKVTPPQKVPEPGFPIGLSVAGMYIIYRKKAKKAKSNKNNLNKNNLSKR